jgi:hypothetical protein
MISLVDEHREALKEVRIASHDGRSVYMPDYAKENWWE